MALFGEYLELDDWRGRESRAEAYLLSRAHARATHERRGGVIRVWRDGRRLYCSQEIPGAPDDAPDVAPDAVVGGR